jgi:flagellar biosynthesis activator protein FlaF
MFKQFYDEIAQDTASDARAAERMAFEKSISLMQKAQAAGLKSREAIEALHFLNRFWTIMLDDLASPENGLPGDLRAKLLSIGIWMIKQAAAIRGGSRTDFRPLIEVSETVLAGLGPKQC